MSVQDCGAGAIAPCAGAPRVHACPLCRSRTFKSDARLWGPSIQLCEDCGLLLQNPQPSDRELADIYGAGYFIGSGGEDVPAAQFDRVKRATAAHQLDAIAAYLGQLGASTTGLRLIEIGCGHGNLLVEAQSRNYQIEGVEYSPSATAAANAKLGRDVVRTGTISSVPLPQSAYDICILADVLEHVRDPQEFMSSVQRILKPGGIVFIATPSTESWSAKLLGRHWMEFKREHLFYFNDETISKLLTMCGFSHIRISTGRKVLTPEYIIGHFDRFPVPVVSGVLRGMRRLMPQRLLRMQIKVTASGIDVLAVKSR